MGKKYKKLPMGFIRCKNCKARLKSQRLETHLLKKCPFLKRKAKTEKKLKKQKYTSETYQKI